MTTATLLTKIYSLSILKQAKFEFGDSDIKLAANYAQQQMLQECELLEETGTLAFVANQETYTSAVTTWLPKAFRIKEPITYADTTKGIIVARSKQWVDNDRQRVADGGSNQDNPKFFYVLKTSPLTIGFWYIPSSVLTVNVRYVRQHASTDDIATSVAPLIPDAYERCFHLGIAAFMLEDAGPEMAEMAADARAKFEAEKQKVRVLSGLVDQSINPPQGDVLIW